MAGTNAVAVKRALVAALTASASLTGVQVLYSSWDRDLEREAIYFGKTAWTHTPAAMRSGGSLPRIEDLVLDAYVFVAMPGSTPEDAEDRVQELGEVLENILAADPAAAAALAVTGAKYARVLTGELGSEFDDDTAYALAVYKLGFTSCLT